MLARDKSQTNGGRSTSGWRHADDRKKVDAQKVKGSEKQTARLEYVLVRLVLPKSDFLARLNSLSPESGSGQWRGSRRTYHVSARGCVDYGFNQLRYTKTAV